MSIKKDEFGNIMITGDGISKFRSLAILHALRLEVNHGLKNRRNMLHIARRDAGVEFANRKAALKWYEEHWGKKAAENEKARREEDEVFGS